MPSDPKPFPGEPPAWMTTDARRWTIHRTRRGRIVWWQRWYEAWLIVSGQWSLHRAFQDGLDHGSRLEYHRTVVMGGR